MLILTYKLHCASKTDALKWPVLKSDSCNSIVLTLNAGWLLLSSAEFSFEIIFSKNMSFRNTSRFSNSMDPDNAQHFSLNLATAVDKVYLKQANI